MAKTCSDRDNPDWRKNDASHADNCSPTRAGLFVLLSRDGIQGVGGFAVTTSPASDNYASWFLIPLDSALVGEGCTAIENKRGWFAHAGVWVR